MAATGHRDAKNGISDAPEERYEFSVSLPGGGAPAASTSSQYALTTVVEKCGQRQNGDQDPLTLI